MPRDSQPNGPARLKGHALRNFNLRERSVARAGNAPPLARSVVTIRAKLLGMTRLEFARRSGIGRGTMRDLELGVHTPTRNTLRRFIVFCEKRGIAAEPLEELRKLYAGSGDTIEQHVARLELLAGSTRELARRVGISASTLWEYRRGHFPITWSLLCKLCKAVSEDPAALEPLWHESERQRLIDRGYPPAWAELTTLATREGLAENRLARLGLRTAAMRRLRYLELPPWAAVEKAARALCHNDGELEALRALWTHDERVQAETPRDRFGPGIKSLREAQGISRRELADLFHIGGKKPARILKHIEEDGFYSTQAYPAGLAAILTTDAAEQEKLLSTWCERRRHFHRRHRPETRVELRLQRELFGFELSDIDEILGYSSLEYQRIERGVEPMLESAEMRIRQAIADAGRRRVARLLAERRAILADRSAWRAPATVPDLIRRLARRDGGLAPLVRNLRKASVPEANIPAMRAVAMGEHVPTWPVLEAISRAGNVEDLSDLRNDWAERFRARTKKKCESPLGVEIRLLIAEVERTVRAFSRRLPFNYSVLIRDLQRFDRDCPIRWYHVERILRAARLAENSERWQEIHALWYTMDERRKKAPWARRFGRTGTDAGGASGRARPG